MMIIGTWFVDFNPDVGICLSCSISRKRITCSLYLWLILQMYLMIETMPSGTYWVYVIDSLVNDLRLELVALSPGDPRSARVVGGDDAYMLLRIAAFDWPTMPDLHDRRQVGAREFVPVQS